MLKALLKKQFYEVFKSFFFNQKTNKKNSTTQIISKIVLFLILILGVLGGLSISLSLSICKTLTSANLAWLYFLILSGLAIIVGIFGSVFTTYSGLYLSKDNDLLLSMPIPVKYVLLSRIINVYLLGAIYSLPIILPSLIIYYIVSGTTLLKIVCGLLLLISLETLILVLSCLLGWCVAKISLKIKNKSFVTVILYLVFIALYYVVYFKAQQLIEDLILNATVYGNAIKGNAYILYKFGTIGEGNVLPALLFTILTSILSIIAWLLLKNTFLSITISSGKSKTSKQKQIKTNQNSKFGSLLKKEFAKFASNPNYMLNCGLGILFIPIFAVFVLIKGNSLISQFTGAFGDYAEAIIVLCAIIMSLVSMNDIVTPSVSLEGKNVWILQSLPVKAKSVLNAKLFMQLILTTIPTAIMLICCLIALKASLLISILICLLILSFILFCGLFDSFLGLKLSIMNWTSDLLPIKQSSAIFISLFGTWGIVAGFAILYFVAGFYIGLVYYLLACTLIFVLISILLWNWLVTKGATLFSNL